MSSCDFLFWTAHKWGVWGPRTEGSAFEVEWGVRTGKSWPVYVQNRVCQRCGKEEVRQVTAQYQ